VLSLGLMQKGKGLEKMLKVGEERDIPNSQRVTTGAVGNTRSGFTVNSRYKELHGWSFLITRDIYEN